MSEGPQLVTVSFTLPFEAGTHFLGLAEAAFEEHGHSISYFEETNPDTQRLNWQFVMYVPERETLQIVTKIEALLEHENLSSQISVEPLIEQDWVAMSLEGLKPIPAGDFFVHGAHDNDKVPVGKISLLIEAGQAFGTGHHGTTLGCLKAISELTDKRSFENSLDVGTGSGLLAIGYAKKTGKSILATDIDPVAVETAIENGMRNNVEKLFKVVEASDLEHPLLQAHSPFDLIIANILAKPLISLSKQICENIAKNGIIILSGLLDEQVADVFSAYGKNGASLVKQISYSGWSTLVLSAT